MTDYASVVALRNITEDSKRGYAFEQAIREILPWTGRPPLAILAHAEQLDAFFEWNGMHFLVERRLRRNL